MSLSLADLKKSKSTRLESLIKSQEEATYKDNRFWQPTVDKAGNGAAVIRFLPASPSDGLDSLPWVKYFEHGFKGPSGRWYIEKSRTSLTSLGKEDQKDPLAEYNSKLWNTNDPELQAQVRKQKRKLTFVANILVINDPAVPENNGKVFLYKFGQKIFDKIKGIMAPDEQLGEQANDPFDFWTGQNFKLKIKKVSDFRNYDDSSFAASSPIAKTDEEIDAIWNKQYSLKEFNDPSTYKSYDELKTLLYSVLEIRDETVSASAERASLGVDDAMGGEADDTPFDMSGEDSDLDAILKGI